MHNFRIEIILHDTVAIRRAEMEYFKFGSEYGEHGNLVILATGLG